ncbi:prepilin peptidase [Serratia sp. NPDC078593]|uniref:prepilin peptidase n=1 Tax=unclassified Serratia (in: enterobacteria) TaxID=2647522 RepID=UPI0037D8C8C2
MEDIWLPLLWLSIVPASWLAYQLILRAQRLMQWRWQMTQASSPPVAFAAVAGACTFAAVIIGLAHPPPGQLLLLMALAIILTALAFIDHLYQWLPDSLTLPLLWGGLWVNLHWPFVPLADSVRGAICGYLLLWGINRIYLLVRGRQGIGHGDFKLLAALGAWGGWNIVPMILLLASLCALLIGLPLYLQRQTSWQTPLPFGSYLALAGGLSLAFLASVP